MTWPLIRMSWLWSRPGRIRRRGRRADAGGPRSGAARWTSSRSPRRCIRPVAVSEGTWRSVCSAVELLVTSTASVAHSLAVSITACSAGKSLDRIRTEPASIPQSADAAPATRARAKGKHGCRKMLGHPSSHSPVATGVRWTASPLCGPPPVTDDRPATSDPKGFHTFSTRRLSRLPLGPTVESLPASSCGLKVNEFFDPRTQPEGDAQRPDGRRAGRESRSTPYASKPLAGAESKKDGRSRRARGSRPARRSGRAPPCAP
jgi:hypothetical protein